MAFFVTSARSALKIIYFFRDLQILAYNSKVGIFNDFCQVATCKKTQLFAL